MTTSSDHARLDLSGMYAAHDSFRRDLDRLTRAAGDGPPAFDRARGGWENFKAQLLLHHQAEDENLWPRLRRVAVEPDHLLLLDDMRAEHAAIDPLVRAIDTAADRHDPALADLVGTFADQLDRHLTHEEEAALPVVEALLTSADWRAFVGGIRRTQGIRGAAVYLPWVLDGEPTAWQRRFVTALPAPARLLNRAVLQRRYRRRHLWP